MNAIRGSRRSTIWNSTTCSSRRRPDAVRLPAARPGRERRTDLVTSRLEEWNIQRDGFVAISDLEALPRTGRNTVCRGHLPARFGSGVESSADGASCSGQGDGVDVVQNVSFEQQVDGVIADSEATVTTPLRGLRDGVVRSRTQRRDRRRDRRLSTGRGDDPRGDTHTDRGTWRSPSPATIDRTTTG